MYQIAQTFYLDPNAFSNASSIHLSGVQVFVKSVPGTSASGLPTAPFGQSGLTNPGISIVIAETVAGVPDLQNIIADSYSRVPWFNANNNQNYIAQPPENIGTAYNILDCSINFWFGNTELKGSGDQFTSGPPATPIQLTTNKTYAILVNFEDPGFQLWNSTKGNYLVGANVANYTTNIFNGGLPVNSPARDYYTFSSDGTWRIDNSTTLTFCLYISKFSSNNINVILNNRNFEFLTCNSMTSDFTGGENVFMILANSNGTISISNTSNAITGTGTTFLNQFHVNDFIVAVSGSNYQALQISNVNSNTSLSLYNPPRYNNTVANYFKSCVGACYYENISANVLFLSNSNANSTLFFAAGNTIRGELSGSNAVISNVFNFSAADVTPEIFIGETPNSTTNLQIVLANSTYGVTNTNLSTLINNTDNIFNNYQAFMASRSNEVLNSAGLKDGKSSIVYANIAVKFANLVWTPANGQWQGGVWECPFLTTERLDAYYGTYLINNPTLTSYSNGVNGPNNENTNSGSANSKHITQIFNLPAGQFAEDLLVYIHSYKPAQCNLYVYAKLHNSNDPETFDSKNWTLMNPTNNTDLQVSSLSNNNDIKEFTYDLPPWPPTSLTSPGTVTTTNGSTTITGSNTTFNTTFAVGNVVKIYQPLFPLDYMITVVNSITNATSMTITDLVVNNGVTGAGLQVDLIATPQTAFLYGMNSNVAQYYNSNSALFSTFDSYQVKVVLTSNSNNIIPILYDLRGIAVTA